MISCWDTTRGEWGWQVFSLSQRSISVAVWATAGLPLQCIRLRSDAFWTGSLSSCASHINCSLLSYNYVNSQGYGPGIERREAWLSCTRKHGIRYSDSAQLSGWRVTVRTWHASQSTVCTPLQKMETQGIYGVAYVWYISLIPYIKGPPGTLYHIAEAYHYFGRLQHVQSYCNL